MNIEIKVYDSWTEIPTDTKKVCRKMGYVDYGHLRLVCQERYNKSIRKAGVLFVDGRPQAWWVYYTKDPDNFWNDYGCHRHLGFWVKRAWRGQGFMHLLIASARETVGNRRPMTYNPASYYWRKALKDARPSNKKKLTA